MKKKEVSQFAARYLPRFEQCGFHIFEDHRFPDDCRALGFEMDCGESLHKAFPDLRAFESLADLEKILDSTEDIHLLGSALFSRWRWFNHWAMAEPDEEVWIWFRKILERMKLLSETDA